MPLNIPELAHTNTLEFARMCVDAHYKRTAFRSLGEEALTVLRDAFPK